MLADMSCGLRLLYVLRTIELLDCQLEQQLVTTDDFTGMSMSESHQQKVTLDSRLRFRYGYIYLLYIRHIDIGTST